MIAGNLHIYLLTALFLTLATLCTNAQDTLVTVKGDFMAVQLVEIKKTKIVYKEILQKRDSAEMQEMPLREVFIIKFNNGLKQIFPEHLNAFQEVLQPDFSATQLTNLGISDAYAHFGPKPREFGVAAITVLSPPAGLIIALTTNTAPHPENFTSRHPELLANEQYVTAYRKEGKRIKKGKALRGFAGGLGAYVLLVAVLISETEK